MSKSSWTRENLDQELQEEQSYKEICRLEDNRFITVIHTMKILLEHHCYSGSGSIVKF